VGLLPAVVVDQKGLGTETRRLLIIPEKNKQEWDVSHEKFSLFLATAKTQQDISFVRV
jgi:hypothetical protein